DDDSRSLTTTGGLGFFGGPGSNYALHGIATMAEKISNGEFKTGMTTALGWFMHKYAVGIYADSPNDRDLSNDNLIDDKNPDAGRPPVASVENYRGEGLIDTYTVVYSRERTPVKTIVLGTATNGARFVANTDGEDEVFEQFLNHNQIGKQVLVEPGPNNTNIARLQNN
ncbi:MAG: hypothetical protein AAF387_19680, partial [Pseudomonadota bacterium]